MADTTTTGFEWGALPEGSIVVDVRGGIGSTALIIARAFPKLKFVIQDRPDTVVEGEKVRSLTSVFVLTPILSLVLES